jgi:hypothetical protein
MPSLTEAEYSQLDDKLFAVKPQRWPTTIRASPTQAGAEPGKQHEFIMARFQTLTGFKKTDDLAYGYLYDLTPAQVTRRNEMAQETKLLEDIEAEMDTLGVAETDAEKDQTLEAMIEKEIGAASANLADDDSMDALEAELAVEIAREAAAADLAQKAAAAVELAPEAAVTIEDEAEDDPVGDVPEIAPHMDTDTDTDTFVAASAPAPAPVQSRVPYDVIAKHQLAVASQEPLVTADKLAFLFGEDRDDLNATIIARNRINLAQSTSDIANWMQHGDITLEDWKHQLSGQDE